MQIALLDKFCCLLPRGRSGLKWISRGDTGLIALSPPTREEGIEISTAMCSASRLVRLLPHGKSGLKLRKSQGGEERAASPPAREERIEIPRTPVASRRGRSGLKYLHCALLCLMLKQSGMRTGTHRGFGLAQRSIAGLF